MILSMLGSIISIGFPTIATYKALKANDIALMRPWLMYWSVYSLGTFVESVLGSVIRYIPFYNFLRLGGLVWLVTAGGVQIWTSHVEPYISGHESEIDNATKNVYKRFQGQADDNAAPNDTLFSQFRLPISPDSVVSALASSWKAPKTSEQAQQQRSLLESMIHSLDAKSSSEEEFVAVEQPTQPAPRRGWLW